MNQESFNFLVEKAKELNNHSKEFAISFLYSKCGENTNINDIELAVEEARKEPKKRTDKDILYLIANDTEFLQAEKLLKSAISKIIDVHIKYDKRCGLTPRQSNDALETMTKIIKEKLFTETLLRQII